ncbi:MAG: hypothetical protein EOP81_17150 [Variovorax sp.]|nr:MAG: hypothetical protein EOP81_17150 [Variovorax sp.]
MDAATAWGLGLTILGTVASIWGAIISIQQAVASKKSASEAKRATQQMVNQRRTSDLAELKVHCERAQKSMEKYGPGASAMSLSGINPDNDAADVRTLLLEANKNRESFHRGEVDIFVVKISPLLDMFVHGKERTRIQQNGKAVLMEVSNFLAVVKSSHDAKRESTSAEA